MPQIVVPHALDQYFWAGRGEALGIGPRSIRKGRLESGALAAAIGACDAPDVRRAAEKVAAAMRTDGADRAVDWLEASVGREV